MDKATKACADYAAANARIRALTKLIGESLAACWEAHPDKDQPYESHIAKVLAFETDEDGRRDYLDAYARKEILAECPHCTAAWQAIQDRKAARKAFGVAKRAIGAVGRAALKSQEVAHG